MNVCFEIGCLSIIQKQAARADTVLNENEKDLNGTRRSSDFFFWFQASCICLTGAWEVRRDSQCSFRSVVRVGKLFMVAFGNEKYLWVYICDIICVTLSQKKSLKSTKAL